MSGFRLAVDYGTSYTAAAVADGTGTEVLEFGGARNSRYLPSLVLVDQRGDLHVGTRAVAKRGSVPGENVCVAPKRQLGPDSLRIGPRELSPVDVVAATLTKVAEEVIHRNNGRPADEVVMTHPATWSEARCAVLRSAAASAGLVSDTSSIELMPEPVAAARFYAQSHDGPEVPVGGAVAVYDLGGGTFDCAVLRRTETGWMLAGPPGGDERLGGEDFDEALLEWVADRVAADDADRWGDFEDDDSPRGRSDWVTLLEFIRSAKEDLSTEESTEIGLPPGALPLDALLIHRSEFTILIAGPVERSMEAFARCLAEAAVSPSELAATYLTGGSSRIPFIKGELHRRFGVEPITFKDPKAITSLGALAADHAAQPTASGQTAPTEGRPADGRVSTAPPPTVTPQGATLMRAECDLTDLAALLDAVAAFADPDSFGDRYRHVGIGVDESGCGLIAGTPKRAAMAEVSTRAGTTLVTTETLLFDPSHVQPWTRGRSGAVEVSGTPNSLTLTQDAGAEPRRLTISATVLTTIPAYGNPGQREPVAFIELQPAGIDELLASLNHSSNETVSVVYGSTGVQFEDFAPPGEWVVSEPAELHVPRAPLAAALAAYRGRDMFVAAQPHCLVLGREPDDRLNCALWDVGAPTGAGGPSTAAQPTAAEVATVRITPKAILGGVGSMGVRFHLAVDGVPHPTDGWKPVTFELRPGRHEIECYTTSTGRTYSRAKTTIDVFAGQHLNLRFQQGATTFSKGKLVLE